VEKKKKSAQPTPPSNEFQNRVQAHLQAAVHALGELADDWRDAKRTGTLTMETVAIGEALHASQRINGYAAYLTSALQKMVNDLGVQKRS